MTPPVPAAKAKNWPGSARNPAPAKHTPPAEHQQTGRRAPEDSADFRGSGFGRDEIEQFINGHTGDKNPVMDRPTEAQVHDALTKGEPTRLQGQNAETFDYNGVRVIVKYDMRWRSTSYKLR
jgi:hypothetical protein